MDPKMDSGCAKPGEQIEESYDVSRPLLPEEVLGIIDQLICYEVGWLQLAFDALLTVSRCHGTWDTLCLRHSLLVSMLKLF
jgi:hypothetical protein